MGKIFTEGNIMAASSGNCFICGKTAGKVAGVVDLE
jgi:hypothetical protein